MKMVTNIEISACDGRYCKIKERCKRYILFTKNKNNKNLIFVVVNPDTIDCDGKCDKFWDAR